MTPGARLGPYVLLERLGQGGMGVVWKAKDERTGAVVALKRLAPELAADLAVRERAAREAELLRGFEHPNVVRLIDAAPEGAVLVFEYVEGGSLQDRLEKSGPFPWREAARMGAKLARALAAAHVRGLIHRDVKPANVLVDARGEPRLADFGLVRASAGASLTATGETLGTVGFAAPEQQDGSKVVTPASDLYALGATLHALVTGEPPFGAGLPLTVLKRQATERPRPLRQLLPEVPARFESLVLALLEKRPEARPESARAVAEELDAIADGKRAPSKKRVLAPLLGAALVVVAFLVVRAIPRAAPPPPPTPPAPSPHPLPLPAPSLPAEPPPPLIVPGSLSFSRTDDLLLSDLDGEHLLIRSVATGVAVHSLHRPGERITFATFATEADDVAVGSRSGLVEVVDPETKIAALVVRHRSGPVLGLLHRGFATMSGTASEIRIRAKQAEAIDLDLLRKHFPGSVNVYSMRLVGAPEAKPRFAAAGPRWVAVYGFDLGEEPSWQAAPSFDVTAVDLAADGEHVLVGGAHGEVALYEVGSATPVALAPHRARVNAVALSPESKLAITGSDDGVARHHVVALGKTRDVLHATRVTAVAFGHQRRFVAIGSDQGVALYDPAREELLWQQR